MDIVRYLNECARRYLDLAREAPSEESYEAVASRVAQGGGTQRNPAPSA
jgi:hypothetical protein